MKALLVGLFALVISIFSTTAFAGEKPGNLYFSALGGVSILHDSDIDGSPLTLEYDNGWNAGGAIGYNFGVFRTEFEVSYRHNDLDSLAANGASIDADGSITSTSFLINNALDLHNKTAFTPYLGVGLGVAKLSLNDAAVLGVTLVDDSSVEFAYKLFAGTAIEINPNFDLTIDYSFLGTTDPTFEDVIGADVTTSYNSHNVNGGLRFNF